MSSKLVLPNNEKKRMEQITYIMENWDKLPDRIQGRFEGIISTAQDFLVEQPHNTPKQTA